MDSCTGWLPQEKPRYVMGIGYPEDLLVSVALGADMFDCVWPTRTAVSNLFPRQLARNMLRAKIKALWQRHHIHRYQKPPSLLICLRLLPNRSRVYMQMLSSRRNGRARHHKGIHLPRRRQRNDGRTSVSDAISSLFLLPISCGCTC